MRKLQKKTDQREYSELKTQLFKIKRNRN